MKGDLTNKNGILSLALELKLNIQVTKTLILMIAALSGEWCVFDKITMTTGNIEIKCPKCGYINEIDLSLRKGSVKFRKFKINID